VADPYLAVFDCVTFVQSLISETGPAVQCTELFEQGKILLAFSNETLSELNEVLSRSTLRERYPRLTDQRVDSLIALLVRQGRLYRRVKRHIQFQRDPSDEPYLNLAVEAEADFLVTRDRDLLDLMDWKREEGRAFQKRFRRLKIVDPVVFVNDVRVGRHES
jgi:putative PIN family toxin of toxin-antitoxin system